MILNTCAHTNSNPIISVPKWRQLGTRQMKRNYNRNRPISTRKFVRLERNRETVPSDNELCKSWKRFANVFESLALQFPLRLRFTSRAPAYLPYDLRSPIFRVPWFRAVFATRAHRSKKRPRPIASRSSSSSSSSTIWHTPLRMEARRIGWRKETARETTIPFVMFDLARLAGAARKQMHPRQWANKRFPRRIFLRPYSSPLPFLRLYLAGPRVQLAAPFLRYFLRPILAKTMAYFVAPWLKQEAEPNERGVEDAGARFSLSQGFARDNERERERERREVQLREKREREREKG